MTLKELLETMEPDRRIKIGARDGSSFFYCGNPADVLVTFDPDAKCFGWYDKIIHDTFERTIENNKKNVDAVYTDMLDKLKKRGFSINQKSFTDFMRYVMQSGMGDGAIKSERNLEKAINNLKNTKPLMDREVLDHFDCDAVADDGVYAIVVEGFEYGKYWTFDEVPTGIGGTVRPSISLMNMNIARKK